MKTAKAIGALGVLMAALCGAWPASAATQSPSVDGLRAVEEELARQRSESQALEQMERSASVDLEALKARLVRATKEIQDKQEEQELLEEKLATLEKETKAGETALIGAEERLAILTSAMLRMARQPPETLLPHTDSITDNVHRSIVLRRLVPWLREETARLAGELERLEEMRASLAAQREAVKLAGANLEKQRDSLDRMIRIRQGTVRKTAAQREEAERQLAELSKEAGDLRQLLERVNRAAAGAGKSARAGREGGSLKAGLRMPVSGNVSRGYGEKDGDGVASQGLSIAAAPSATVVSPRDGRVMFTGPFRGYGQMVIIQHDGGCHSLLAGFGRIDADVGQKVAVGEPLGNLPAKGASARRPEMYFEWRCDGEPSDPRGN